MPKIDNEVRAIMARVLSGDDEAVVQLLKWAYAEQEEPFEFEMEFRRELGNVRRRLDAERKSI